MSTTPGPVRQLREKNKEFRPYTKDKIDRRRQSQGMYPLTHDDSGVVSALESSSQSIIFKQEEKANPDTRFMSPSLQRPSTNLQSTLSARNRGQSAVTTEEQDACTTLYVGLDGEENLRIPFYLKSCKTIEALFNNIANAWDTPRKKIKSLTVRFPWLAQPNTIVVKNGLPDTFQSLIEEIADAPCWAPNGKKRCHVEVQVYRGLETAEG